MAEPQPQAEAPGPPSKSKKKFVWIILCIGSMVAGAVTPLAFGAHKLLGLSQPAAKSDAEREPTTVPFGEVAVNLSDGRMNRYLRVKVIILVDSSDAKDLTKRLDKYKPVLKNWLIGHLSGKTLKDVGGTVGVKRIQREIQERFEELLYPNGEPIAFEVLFEEFVVQ